MPSQMFRIASSLLVVFRNCFWLRVKRFRKKFRLVQSRADDIAKFLTALPIFRELRVNFFVHNVSLRYDN